MNLMNIIFRQLNTDIPYILPYNDIPNSIIHLGGIDFKKFLKFKDIRKTFTYYR